MKRYLFIFFLPVIVISCGRRKKSVHDHAGNLAGKPAGTKVDSMHWPDTTGYPIFDKWMSDTLRQISSTSDREPFVIKRQVIPDNSSHNLVINTSYRVLVKSQDVYKGDVERLIKLLAEYEEVPPTGSVLSFTTNYWYSPSIAGQAYEVVFRYNPILLNDSIHQKFVECSYIRGRLASKYSISIDKSGKRDTSDYTFTDQDAK